MKEKYNIAEQFCLDRIREFPTLYKNSNAVIASCIVGGRGCSYWENGIIKAEDQHWDNDNKKFVPYPFKISEEVAGSYLIDNAKYISINDINGIINEIPYDAHEDWLQQISMFLFSFRHYNEKTIRLVAESQCFLYYGVTENKNAGLPDRIINNLTKFCARIPYWDARIKEVRFYQHNKKINPDSFVGMFI